MGNKIKDTNYVRDQLARYVWENREALDVKLEDFIYIFNYGTGTKEAKIRRLYKSFNLDELSTG